MYGIVAGGAAVAFQSAMKALFSGTFLELLKHSKAVFLVGSFVTIITTSLAVGFLLTSFCREASGSGIPQLKLAFWKDFGFIPWRVVWVKFVAGVLSVGGGSSLGREGPSVQLAGGLCSQIAGLAGEPKQNRRIATAAGAAAGLAAAFNTPVAAVTFVLEEVMEDLNSRFLGSVLLASVLGAFVVHGLVGKQPAFTLADVTASSWEVYVLTPIVAVAASLVGWVFQTSTLEIRARRKEFRHVPAWTRPAFGALITWVLGSAVFLKTGSVGVFGLGYNDLSSALSTHYDWKLAGILLAAKLVATFSCYGFGSCGGIFSPTLFLGGMCGVFLSGIFGTVMHLNTPDQIVLAVVGMSACLGAVVRAPVTSILIVFEMTHEFSLVPALMLATLVSQPLIRALAKHSFYEALLVQDGHNLEHVIPPRDLQTWQQLPISAIANFQPVLLNSLEPEDVRKMLKGHPYHFFPALVDGSVQGILSRTEAEKALAEKRDFVLDEAISCVPTQSIRRLQFLLIESTTGVVVLLDRPDGKVIGLVTLHDLLRAEVAMAKETASG